MPITIVTPKDYQTYKRDSNDQADIAVSGTYSGSPVMIESSWNGVTFTTLDASPSGGTFSGTLANVGVGQRTLTVRFSNDHATTDTALFVGVGDVFLVAGQSNAAGYGDNLQTYDPPLAVDPNLKATMWRMLDAEWAELSDPSGDAPSAGSPWPLLATLHMADQAPDPVPFCIINTAVGSTGLNNGEWQKGGAQYQDCIDAVIDSGVNAVTAILWHQGETDVSEGGNQSAYQTALSQMLDDMQNDAPALAGVRLVCAQIGDRNSAQRDNVDRIRAAQQNRWINDPDILWGPLTYDIDLNDGDGVHFGSDGDASLQTLAERWWRALRYHYYFPTGNGRAPRFAGATRTGVTVVVLFEGGVFPLNGRDDLTGWRYTQGDAELVTIVAAVASGADAVVLELETEPTSNERISFGSNEDAHDTLFLDSGTYPMPPEPFVDQLVTTDASPEPADVPFLFRIDVESMAGTILGSGPLRSVTRWEYTAKMDKAGTIRAEYAANDAQAEHVTNRCILRAWARLRGIWTEVGAGRVDALTLPPDASGTVMMQASGPDLIGELTDRTVGTLEIGLGTGATQATALVAIGALAPPGWSLLPAPTPINDFIYARFAGESVLGACRYVADRTRTHFYRSSGRVLVFQDTWAASGVRAIRSRGELPDDACAITSLTQTIDTHKLLTQIIAYGSGQGEARLTLAASTHTAPPGYTVDRAGSSITDNGRLFHYGLINHPEFEAKDIAPISNTDADVEEAANMLFDAALHELQQRCHTLDRYTYTLVVEGCNRLLRPLQTIDVIYRDRQQGIDIDDTLYILEATWVVDSTGARTSRLVVSTHVHWPSNDLSVLAEQTARGRVVSAHPQTYANEYALSYTKPLDTEEEATFRFRLGAGIVTLTQVVFEFELLPLRSTVTGVESDVVKYGVHNEPLGATVAIDELEYKVNGGSWLPLEDDITDAGDDWWMLDITSQVKNSTNKRPVQANNLLTLRTLGSLSTINAWQDNASDTSVTTAFPHGLSMGDEVTITGTTSGTPGGADDINGTWTVTAIVDPAEFTIEPDGLRIPGDSATGGSVNVYRAAMIEGQLTIRATTQAIAYGG